MGWRSGALVWAACASWACSASSGGAAPCAGAACDDVDVVPTADASEAAPNNPPGQEDAGSAGDVAIGTTETGSAPEDAALDAGGEGGARVSCDDSALTGECVIYIVDPSLASAKEMDCMQQGGTVGTTCPTAKLVGCCTVLGTTVECLYTPNFGASIQQQCAANQGTWAATP